MKVCRLSIGVIGVVGMAAMVVVVVEWAVWAGGAADGLGSVSLGGRGDVGRLWSVRDRGKRVWPVSAVGC